MENIRRSIGSPSAIIAFEAAGRHLSFTKAANELNVSQPAISRQIRNLEQHIGKPLFARRGNIIRFTDQGQLLFEATSNSFQKIISAVDQIRLGAENNDFVLRSQPVFLTTFVVPILQDLQNAFPNCSFTIQAQENTATVEGNQNTISILYGNGNWPGMTSKLLFKDIYFPVCDPKSRAALMQSTPKQIFNHTPLLQMTEFIDPWMDWATWGKHFEIEILVSKRPQLLNDYEMLLRTCKSGLGVAIGALYQIENALAEGDLVRFTDLIVDSEFGFYIVYQSERIRSKDFENMLSWLQKRAGETQKRCLALL